MSYCFGVSEMVGIVCHALKRGDFLGGLSKIKHLFARGVELQKNIINN